MYRRNTSSSSASAASKTESNTSDSQGGTPQNNLPATIDLTTPSTSSQTSAVTNSAPKTQRPSLYAPRRSNPLPHTQSGISSQQSSSNNSISSAAAPPPSQSDASMSDLSSQQPQQPQQQPWMQSGYQTHFPQTIPPQSSVPPTAKVLRDTTPGRNLILVHPSSSTNSIVKHFDSSLVTVKLMDDIYKNYGRQTHTTFDYNLSYRVSAICLPISQYIYNPTNNKYNNDMQESLKKRLREFTKYTQCEYKIVILYADNITLNNGQRFNNSNIYTPMNNNINHNTTSTNTAGGARNNTNPPGVGGGGGGALGGIPAIATLGTNTPAIDPWLVDLNMLCLINNMQFIVSFSVPETARYLEAFAMIEDLTHCGNNQNIIRDMVRLKKMNAPGMSSSSSSKATTPLWSPQTGASKTLQHSHMWSLACNILSTFPTVSETVATRILHHIGTFQALAELISSAQTSSSSSSATTTSSNRNTKNRSTTSTSTTTSTSANGKLSWNGQHIVSPDSTTSKNVNTLSFSKSTKANQPKVAWAENVPGVGPMRAKAIQEALLHPFSEVIEFQKKKGQK